MHNTTTALNRLLPFLFLTFFITPTLAQPLTESDTQNRYLDPELEEDLITLTSLDTNPSNKDSIPYEALRTFVDVFDNIKQNYIEETSNETLIDNAIRGMIARLDPHSAFFDENEYQAFKEQTDGTYAGVGIVLDFQRGTIQVISAIPGSPAAKAGLQSGDIITAINHQPTQDITLQEAIKLLEGDPDTSLQLSVLRNNDIFDYNLTRERIQTNSVSASWPAQGILRLRITQFQEDTAESLRDAITHANHNQTINGIILDLRNNPGGYLQSAIDSANLFLERGTILSVRNRDQMEQQLYQAEAGDISAGVPIVVLVNRGTASSAEIVAAALQENHRALITGQPTYGKGSVQTIIPLYNGGAIKLTTAKYYTPAGNLIQARGITPNIRLATVTVKSVNDGNSAENESLLYNHLKNEQEKNSDAPPQDSHTTLASSDFMLYEALNILNTLIINAQQQQRPTTIITPIDS